MGRSPSPGLHPLFLGVASGFDKPQLHAKFEVAGFVYYRNIRESVFKRQIRFLSHPLEEKYVESVHVERVGHFGAKY